MKPEVKKLYLRLLSDPPHVVSGVNIRRVLVPENSLKVIKCEIYLQRPKVTKSRWFKIRRKEKITLESRHYYEWWRWTSQ